MSRWITKKQKFWIEVEADAKWLAEHYSNKLLQHAVFSLIAKNVKKYENYVHPHNKTRV